ncbi:DEAD/DEAH box helicase family protein [Acidimicrobiia bacterium]|nr:DEAD/DEAH box helicase family protein [Acidimicrobiia bacterium]
MESKVWEFLSTDEPDPIKRGYKFEKNYAKKYLEKHYLFSKLYKEVLCWDEWEDRPYKTDIGIDLVCFGYDEKITAVQAKAYNPNNTISKPDIDSFITASNSDLFSYRLLLGTTNKIGKNAKTIINNEKRIPFQTHLLTDLEESGFLDICKSSFQKKQHQLKFKPLPHQIQAINKTAKYFEKEDNGQLIMACGSGKTLTSFWITKKIKAEKVLFLAPSISLLAQTLSVWLRNSENRNKNFFVVCSDNTAGANDDSEFVSDYDFPSTTNSKDIADFISTNESFTIFSTYHSSKTVLKEVAKNKVNFDLTICDEAHRLTGKVNDEYGSVLKKTFPTSKKLFMTATPRIISYGIKKAAEGREIELVSMDDKKLFGTVIYELTFGEAIEKQLLADYKIIITGVSNRDLNKKEFIKVKSTTIDTTTYAKAVTLKKTLRKYKLKKVITFHSFIKSASIFSDLLNNLKLSSNYIAGTHSIRERKQLVKKLERKTDQIEILSNARVLSEGIDLPELDCIAFIDPKTSVVDIVQAVGRAIRASKDKKKIGYIVLPLFIDDQSGFQTIYKTIIAMRSHDARMAEELDNFRIQMGQGQNLSNIKISNLVIDLPSYVKKDFKLELNSKIIEASSETWFFWYGLLLKYVEENGDSLLRSNQFYEGLLLGSWTSKQRHKYKNNTLPQEKIQLLEKLKGWVWDYSKFQFESYLNNLDEYLKKYKEMPVAGHLYKGMDLMEMTQTIKWAISLGKYSKEKQKKIEKLEYFYWNKDEYSFNRNVEDLIQFSNREKHSYPDRHHKERSSGKELGSFAMRIRNDYEKKVSKLTPEMIRKIETEVPYWSWLNKDSFLFNDKLIKTKEILKDHSLLELNSIDPVIHQWIRTNNIRHLQKNEKLTSEYKKLEDCFGINIKFLSHKLGKFHLKFLSEYLEIYNKISQNKKLNTKDLEWIEKTKIKTIGKNNYKNLYEYKAINKLRY